MKARTGGTSTILFLSIFLLPAIAFAAITQITINPDGVPLGHWVTYTIEATGPSADYSFSYRCEEGGIGAWTPNPAITGLGNSVMFLEKRVGSQTLKGGQDAISNYIPYTHDWVYSQKAFTVIGPNSETIMSGTDVNSTGNPSMELYVNFQLKCGGTVMGMMIDGDCQERIRRPPQDSGWTGPDDYFSLGSGSIQDHKIVSTLLPAFSNATVGAVFDDLYQQNRIRVKDCSGVERFYYFPERHFQKIKTGASTWKLVEL